MNNDNECFRWHLVRYLNVVDKNLIKIRNDKKFEEQLNFKQNSISINLFGYEKNTSCEKPVKGNDVKVKHHDHIN